MPNRVLLFAALLLLFAAAATAQQPVVSFTSAHYIFPEKTSGYVTATIARTGDLDLTVKFFFTVKDLTTGVVSGGPVTFPTGQSTYVEVLNYPGDFPIDDNFYDPGRGYPAFLTIGQRKPPHRAIKLSVTNNLIDREAAAWNRQSVTLNN